VKSVAAVEAVADAADLAAEVVAAVDSVAAAVVDAAATAVEEAAAVDATAADAIDTNPPLLSLDYQAPGFSRGFFFPAINAN
jgi:hypothetical protein